MCNSSRSKLARPSLALPTKRCGPSSRGLDGWGGHPVDALAPLLWYTTGVQDGGIRHPPIFCAYEDRLEEDARGSNHSRAPRPRKRG